MNIAKIKVSELKNRRASAAFCEEIEQYIRTTTHTCLNIRLKLAIHEV